MVSVRVSEGQQLVTYGRSFVRGVFSDSMLWDERLIVGVWHIADTTLGAAHR